MLPDGLAGDLEVGGREGNPALHSPVVAPVD